MAAPSWRISGSRGPGLGGGSSSCLHLVAGLVDRCDERGVVEVVSVITTSFASRSTSTCWTPGTALTSARRRCLPRGRHTRRRRNLRDRRRGRRQRLASEAGATAGFWRRVWSVYGAQRSQPVATGGKWASRGDGSNTRKALPWVATSCRDPKMVRVDLHPDR